MYFYERRKLRSGYFRERRVFVKTGLFAIRDMSSIFGLTPLRRFVSCFSVVMFVEFMRWFNY